MPPGESSYSRRRLGDRGGGGGKGKVVTVLWRRGRPRGAGGLGGLFIVARGVHRGIIVPDYVGGRGGFVVRDPEGNGGAEEGCRAVPELSGTQAVR